MILLPLEDSDLIQFKRDMQEAFNKGAEQECGENCEVLPEEDIDKSLKSPKAEAYKVVLDGEMVGGAVVQVNTDIKQCELDFLYVKYGYQGRKIGQFIWNEIESRYPETQVWETHTPYFDQRNIHFYVNVCGFHIVEFFNKYHQDPHMPFEPNEPMAEQGMFRFMKNKKFL